MHRYHLTLLGMCEVRWNGHGETKLQTGETLLYSGKNEEDRQEAGVSMACASAYVPETNFSFVHAAEIQMNMSVLAVIVSVSPASLAAWDRRDTVEEAEIVVVSD
nr:hypothetical protein BaRGS_013467 [Batillaria attramentaria]